MPWSGVPGPNSGSNLDYLLRELFELREGRFRMTERFLKLRQRKCQFDALHDIVLSITNQTTGIRSDFRFRDEDRQEKK